MDDQKPNPIQVQKFLGGIDYPASREEVLSHAKDAGADEAVMTELEGLPEQTFHKPTDISEALS